MGDLYRAKWRKHCNVEEIIAMRATFLIRCLPVLLNRKD